jgi:xylose isomerase
LLGSGTPHRYDGYLHFDYKPPRAEAMDGVWESAAACMRNYLILRERVQAFRADPDVAEAMAAAGVPDLDERTLAEGESLAAVRDAAYDLDALASRSVAQEALDQLAMEHLLGAR